MTAHVLVAAENLDDDFDVEARAGLLRRKWREHRVAMPREHADDDSLPIVSCQFGIAGETFEELVLIGYGSNADLRNRLRLLLEQCVEMAGSIASLTESQSKKLTLAGHGDMERFFADLDALHAKWGRVKDDLIDLNELNADINRPRRKLRVGLFGEGSLFIKTFNRIAAPDQARDFINWRRSPHGQAFSRIEAPSL